MMFNKETGRKLNRPQCLAINSLTSTASTPAEPDKLESPGWHKKILAKRLAKVEAGKGEFLTLTQLKKRLQKP
jgi:hypothetical protein